MSLSPKQKRFVDEFLVDLNGTQAAMRAGYSPRTANEQASRLLANVHVAAAVDAAKSARSERTAINADWVLQRLVDEAEADLADLYDAETGNLKPLHEWPKVWRRGLVAGFEIETVTLEGVELGHIRKVKLSDRTRRLELIGKHIAVKAFEDQVHVTGLDGLGDRLIRAAARCEEMETVGRI